MNNESELVLWMKNFILKFRENFDKLPSKEKNTLQDLFNLNKPCQVESFSIENNGLKYQFHFFTKFENEEDLKIKNKVLNSQNYLEGLEEYLNEEKWNRLLSDSELPNIKGETYSDRMEILIAFGLSTIPVNPINDSEIDIPKSTFSYQTIINPEKPDVFLGMNSGYIQSNDPEEEALNLISLIKGRALKQGTKTETQKSESPIIKGFGTFFYPPIWIGEFPKTKLRDRVNQKPFMQFSKKVQDIKYKNKILIVNNDGFIAIEEKNKNEATNLLNEIMATAVLLRIPVSMVNESEVGSVSINRDNKEIEHSYLKSNSMRTNLFRSQYHAFSDIKMDRTHLSKKDIYDVLIYAEHINQDKTFKNFLIFYLESFTHFQNYSYAQSFILSWLIIERYLSLIWKNEVVDKSKGKKRKNNLKNPGMWSIYYIIETLHLLGIIKTDEQYKTLMKLKRKRDKIVHEGKECSKEEAKECLSNAELCLLKKLGYEGE